MLKRLTIATILCTLTLFSACGADMSGRPTAEQVANGMKLEVLAGYPEASDDLVLDIMAECYGEMIVTSDLSDEAVQVLALWKTDYELTAADEEIIASMETDVAACRGLGEKEESKE